MTQPDIKIHTSAGRGKNGKMYKGVRPLADCFNRSRKVGGYNHQEIQAKIDKVIEKWFSPKVILYRVDGHVIGSNSKENALKEYWRVCEKEKIKQHFEVEII